MEKRLKRNREGRGSAEKGQGRDSEKEEEERVVGKSQKRGGERESKIRAPRHSASQYSG
jgi:hypothetical protein